MAPAVSFLEAVSLTGHFPVLAGLTLEVNEGEVVHLRGPNGAGKTSLLRACAGLLPIVSGEAVVLGHDLKADRVSVRREVAHLGHKTFLYDDLTVEENVRFAVRAARAPTTGIEDSLGKVELNGRLRTTAVGRLSAGQRRRTALAVVIARGARLWLLDEPHAGLDEEGREVLDRLVAAAANSGGTVLFASHELERAESIATRSIEIRGGAAIAASPARRRRSSAHEAKVNLDVA
ncbi:MAG TPA: heme ABC exporter ATP-binding protein CcmA [Acidimicrobiales bacterium]|nr:heme ABC exporter ATP-binding protein CcmA [Acidimicrobiales bacterium]